MKYKVGDIVRFKSWDEMEKEFGVSARGCILCQFNFPKEMNFLCNREFKISYITSWTGDSVIRGKYKDDYGRWLETHYSISVDMIKPNNKNRRIIAT